MEDLGRAYNRGAPFAVKPHTWQSLSFRWGLFSCLSLLFLHLNKRSVILKISMLWPSTVGWSLLRSLLVMFPLHSPQPLKTPNSIRRKRCCPGFSQGTCVPSLHESYVGEWHRKLAGEACDMPKSMLIFLIITLWFRNVCVCSCMRIHTYSFLVPSSAFGLFMIPSVSKCALLHNGLAIKCKLREFLVTVSVHPLNSRSVN